MRTGLAAIVGGMMVLSVVACADNRPTAVQDSLAEQIAAQSAGALILTGFTKTNGVEMELAGTKMYTLEWQARISVTKDVWKRGNAFVGYWEDFSVVQTKPGMYEELAFASSSKRLFNGATVVLNGESQLQKADNGWRVVSTSVKGGQFLNNVPPDNPTEGRFADIQVFWNAFRQAVATKNPEAVAKFVRFPLHIQETPMVQESEFRSQPALWDGTLLQPLLDAVSPTKVDERWYKVSGSQFSVYFQKDRDGYWKWTHYDHGSLLMDEVETPEDVVTPIPPQ